MEKALAEINAVAGVRGSFICDNRGEVIANATPASLDTATLNSIGHQVTQTMAALETVGEAMSEVNFMYDRTRLVARDLAKAVLVVLCEPQIKMALLRLTLNVVTARLKGDSGTQSQFETRAVEKEIAQNDMNKISWQLLKVLNNEEVKNV